MARMLPSLSVSDLESIKSNAERTFYTWCRQYLDDKILVMRGVNWIDFDESRGAYDGESDFVICDERHGIIVVEIKGGGVHFDAVKGAWTSVDRRGIMHDIKSPFQQAMNGKYRILRALNSDRIWCTTFGHRRPKVGHAVFFPDLSDVAGIVGVNAPRQLVGCRKNGAANLREWVEEAFHYTEGDGTHELRASGVEIVRQILRPDVDVRPLFVTALEDAENIRVRLTQEQSSILALLNRHDRALISGGAGTGKTLIAVEKTKRLAAEGQRTVLLCYNEPLAKYLERTLRNVPKATAMTFHGFCGWAVAEVRKKTGRDLIEEVTYDHRDWDLYDDVLPEALARSSEILEDRFDAIVVDEGQDFKSNYWFPLDLATTEVGASVLYIFFDENQALYSDSYSFPIDAKPYSLTRNCRNSSPVHEAAYRFYRGPAVLPSGIVGKPIEILVGKNLVDQARAIRDAIARLIEHEGIATDQIVVLAAGTPKLDYYDALDAVRLPHGLAWDVADVARNDASGTRRAIRFDTVARFKGLEADIVFLWGADRALESGRTELLYVGISRAKTHLYVVGDSEVADALVSRV